MTEFSALNFPRLTALRYILLLVVALITVEAGLTEHELEHGFEGVEEVCLSCDKANNFHSAFITVVITTVIPSAFVAWLTAYSVFYLLNLAAGYFPRAPPA